MSNNENINSYIENYLNSYLKIDKPEFAILLSGKWGSGKTYFIENYIEKKDKTEDIKFIKISLFGLKNTDSIDEQIFQNLHPVLGNKYVKLTGALLKNTVKLGINLDWNDDTKKDGTSSVDLSKFNLLEYFSDKKSNKELIFVFDDLERTDIELTEILGYINYLVEQSDFKVIILANEEELRKEDEENKDYDKFKEKVIGKTFEVQHDFSTVLHSFIENKKSKFTKCLLDNFNKIENIYKEADYQNLRHINQILLDFEYFMNLIDSEYLKNEEFVSILINNFFALSIELKSGKLKEEELKKHKDSMFNFINKDKKESNIEKIYKKYNIGDAFFSGEGWVMVLLKSSLSSEVINEVFSKLSFFREKTNSKELSWRKLYNYQELENIEFDIAKQDVLDKFNNCEYEDPQEFLHVISLLIFFNKKKLSNLTFEKIKEQVLKSIEQYKKTIIWKEKLFNNGRSSYGAYTKYLDESKEFGELYELIINENKKTYDTNQELIEKNKLEEFLTAIKEYDEEVIRELLLNKYKEKPVLKKISGKDFLQLLKDIENKSLNNFRDILEERYPNNYYIGNEEIYCYYLKEELGFWKEIDKELPVFIAEFIAENKMKTLQAFLLEKFHEEFVKDLVEKLGSCDKRELIN